MGNANPKVGAAWMSYFSTMLTPHKTLLRALIQTEKFLTLTSRILKLMMTDEFTKSIHKRKFNCLTEMKNSFAPNWAKVRSILVFSMVSENSDFIEVNGKTVLVLAQFSLEFRHNINLGKI